MFTKQTAKILLCSFKPKLTRFAPSSRKIFTSRPRCDFFNANHDENFNAVSVNILTKDVSNIIMIKSYSKFGFRLNSDVFALGPIAILPTSMFAWTVATHHDINISSLSLFWLMEPQVDILVIGTGDEREAIDPEIRAYLTSKHISTEVQDTRQACATYNYLAYEQRNVGAALIPPTRVYLSTAGEHLQSQMVKGQFGLTMTKTLEGEHEHHALEDARQSRIADKVWSGELDSPFVQERDYMKKLKEWKDRPVDEDDRVSFDQFEKKTERDIIKEKKKNLSDNTMAGKESDDK